MFKPNELEAIPLEVEQQFKELENRVMADIVRRIKINSDITRSADWQIYRLKEFGKSKTEIKKLIKDTLSLSDKEVDSIYNNAINSGYSRDKELYKATGKDFIPFKENKSLQKLITATALQTKDTLKNITQSLGFATRQADGTLKFTELADYYQKTLDGAVFDITSGAFDYNTVLNRVIKEMTNSGLRTVDYASGWSNRVEVASRRAVMTGVNQVTAKINEDNAKKLDTEYFETTWHSGARPEHQLWQGRVYTREQLQTICGLGEVTGLCGANCYHNYYPFIPGISERTYSDDELAKLNAEENLKRDYNGKSYTKYEALQKQRRLETAMRAKRQEIKLLQEGGADEDSVIASRCRYRALSSEYVRFSESMNLPQQRQRVYGDGLGGIGRGKYTVPKSNKSVAKSSESGIIEIGSDGMAEIVKLGRLKTQPLEVEFGKLKTDEIIITDERIEHIKTRHIEDFELFEKYGAETVENPDMIIKDLKNDETVFMIKKLEDTNLNVVAKLVLESNEKDIKNSVMTFYRIRNKNLIKLENKNKLLYRKE